MLNALGYDIRILGNHEFDNGGDSIAHWMKMSNAELLSTNYDLSGSALGPLFKPFTIKEYDGRRIGFIGINRDPEGLARVGTYNGVKYTDAIEAASAAKLKMDAVIVRENWTGGGSDAVLPCGEFELDSVVASGPPAVINIKGTSLPFSAQVRQTKKSKAWENYTLSGIAKEIAGANGMVCMYESAADPFYTRVEQIKTSDIQFLETLCHNAGISLKATTRTLALFDQAAYESKAAVFTIRRGSGVCTKYKLNVGTADTQYSSCRVSYVDPKGKCISATAKIEDYNADAKNNQQLEITAKVTDKDEAKALAEKLLRKHNRYAKTASFTLPGNPDLVAGVTVMLEKWGGWDGKYIVTQAKHTVGGSGYTVQVRLRRVLEGY